MGLPDEKDKGRLFDAVLSFFGVADRDAVRPGLEGAGGFIPSVRSVQAVRDSVVSWLRIAQLEAQGAKAEPYSASSFRKVLQADPRALNQGRRP